MNDVRERILEDTIKNQEVSLHAAHDEIRRLERIIANSKESHAKLQQELSEVRDELHRTEHEIDRLSRRVYATLKTGNAPVPQDGPTAYGDVDSALEALLSYIADLRSSVGGEHLPSTQVRHVGLHVDRLAPEQNNPREVAFAELWQHEQLTHLLTNLLGLKRELTQRECTVAATVIQWLGSNVGMDFLRMSLDKVGYTITLKRAPAKLHTGDLRGGEFLIYFEDHDVPPELWATREAAEKRLQACLMNWSCHLYTAVPFEVYPADEYHEDFGSVLWWNFPINEPPDVDVSEGAEHHTHWSRLPITWDGDGQPLKVGSLR